MAGSGGSSISRDLATEPATEPATERPAAGSAVTERAPLVARLEAVTQRYGKTVALDGVSLDVPEGRLVGLVGPDGVGNSTRLAILSDARHIQSGSVTALASDIGDAAHPPRSARASPTCRRALGKISIPI